MIFIKMSISLKNMKNLELSRIFFVFEKIKEFSGI